MSAPDASWSKEQKLKAVLIASKKYLPAEVGRQIDALVSPQNLATMAATLSVWAGAHFFGVGEIVDVGLLLVGALMIGWSIESVGRDLYEFGTLTIRAKSESDVDAAARRFASAVITAGVTAVMAILLKRSASKLQAARGATLSEVARPQNPASQTWRSTVKRARFGANRPSPGIPICVPEGGRPGGLGMSNTRRKGRRPNSNSLVCMSWSIRFCGQGSDSCAGFERA